MTVTYQCQNFDPANVVRRYAANTMDGTYVIHDVGANSRTMRTTRVNREDLPPAIADECDKFKGMAFNQVLMP